MTYTIKAKIKQTRALDNWFVETSRLAAQLYNACLKLQFELAACGETLLSTIDLINRNRAFSLGSDYKDRTIERAVKSTCAWHQSESLRYELYWKNLEKHSSQTKQPKTTEHFSATNLPFLRETDCSIARQNNFRNFVKNLSRKQKIVGKPRWQKSISLAFAIRKERQDTISIN